MKAFKALALLGVIFCFFSLSSYSPKTVALDEALIKCTCKNGQCVSDGNGGNKCNTSGNCSSSDGNCYQGPVEPELPE